MDDDQYTEVEGMVVDVSGSTALIEGFAVEWDGGRSRKADPCQTINFNGVEGLAPNTPVWPFVIVTGGPDIDSADPVRFVPGTGVKAVYTVSGDAPNTRVEFSGTMPLP